MDSETTRSAMHTIVLSDIHLSTAEPVNPRDRLWKRFKQKDFFIDEPFSAFLDKVQEELKDKPVELVLAGDIFDFDGVNQMPTPQEREAMGNPHIAWIEKKRGLDSEEPKSLFKIRRLISEHPVFFSALNRFVSRGGKLIFIIGNHDLELHWPSTQAEVRLAMGLTAEQNERVRFNNWFYVSNGDTLIEHGNQHDSHSNCQNPVNPKIHGIHGDRIRLPFGCLADRYMINGMGYFNPHSDRSYLMSFLQYLSFAFLHMFRKEPILIWTWFWGAIVTLIMTLREGVAPEAKDPLLVEDQVEEIAKNANATPRMVRLLKEIHAPPMFLDPLSIARELWLDRAFLVMFAFFVGFEVMSVLNLVVTITYWWMFLVVALMLPFLIFYFRSVKSKVVRPVKYYERAVRLGARITGVQRVVYGHTHEFVHTNFEGIEYLNSGTWSPAFEDIACTRPSSPKTFVWIRPNEQEAERVANVYAWERKEINLLC